jgi:hypothetical protein
MMMKTCFESLRTRETRARCASNTHTKSNLMLRIFPRLITTTTRIVPRVLPNVNVQRRQISTEELETSRLKRDLERFGLKEHIDPYIKYRDDCKSIVSLQSRASEFVGGRLHSIHDTKTRSHGLDSKHVQQVRLSSVSNVYVPFIVENAFVAPCATLVGTRQSQRTVRGEVLKSIVGNVEVWDHASVWYGCTIKGDVKLVRIGAYSNVQDKTVISEAVGPLDENHDGSTIVGHYVTVGEFARATCNDTRA